MSADIIKITTSDGRRFYAEKSSIHFEDMGNGKMIVTLPDGTTIKVDCSENDIKEIYDVSTLNLMKSLP